MRLLLTASPSYAPPRGGSTRSNLTWLNYLASRGHACRIVCGAPGAGAELRPHPSIAIFPVAEPARRWQTLRAEIRGFQPDWVLVSSEDLGHALLREAHHSAAGRVVYLAHTPQFFPFGPASWNPDPHAAALVAQSAGIVTIGRHMAGYVEGALGRPAVVIHPPIYGSGPFPRLSNFGRGLAGMINPCAVKGISIFLEVAARMPDGRFGAVPGWGTTAEDRRALARLPNIELLPNARRIDDLLARMSVLLMPSLWYEGFGLIVMEAMLRGLPVVASNAGGLEETKRGSRYIIPVAAIERYLPVFDELAMPQPVIPENRAEPWVAALAELLSDRGAYEREAEASRRAAEAFVSTLDAGEMERFLLALRAGPQSVAPATRPEPPTVESLSPEKRALLLQRLHQRRSAR